MDYSRLEQNICDVIKEEQVKLGYQKEVIRLYYPLLSLNRFLESDLSIKEMKETLKDFGRTIEDKLGTIEVSNNGERFCLCFSPEASEYIYLHTEQTGFLYDFINEVSRHGTTIEAVIDQFKKYSDCVHVEKVSHGEFDYLVYFEDGKPDAFRYCLTDEGCHIIYHRFTVDDYQDFLFEEKENSKMKVLVVVDAQNDFINGALPADGAMDVLPNIKNKIEQYRKAGDKIIYTRDTHTEDYLKTQEGKKLPVIHCVRETKGWEIYAGLYVPGAPIVDKVSFGSLHLAGSIRDAGDIDSIEVIGFCTDICVISNALILKAGFPETEIAVDASCCAGVTRDSHKRALDAMKMCQITVTGE